MSICAKRVRSDDTRSTFRTTTDCPMFILRLIFFLILELVASNDPEGSGLTSSARSEIGRMYIRRANGSSLRASRTVKMEMILCNSGTSYVSIISKERHWKDAHNPDLEVDSVDGKGIKLQTRQRKHVVGNTLLGQTACKEHQIPRNRTPRLTHIDI